MMTFKGSPQGSWIRSVTPTPNSVTVHQHHSFIALPEVPMTPGNLIPVREQFLSVITIIQPRSMHRPARSFLYAIV